MELGKMWAGRVYGTNTGNFFLVIESAPVENSSTLRLSGTLRLMDSLFGLTVYRVIGSFDGARFSVEGEAEHAQAGVETGSIRATATLTPEGTLRGTWESSLGTAGTFEGHPHDVPASSQTAGAASQSPEQIYTSNISLGAVRLYAKDVWEIVEFIRKDFITGRPIITYFIRGNEVTKYFDDFKNGASSLGELRYLKITIQEPDAHGINKGVTVELNALGRNDIRVQGIGESWVIGKAEAVARTLRGFEKGLVTTYKKFGLTLNQVIFMAMLIVIPAINAYWRRAVFVIVVMLMLQTLFWVHNRFIPNAALYFSEKEPTLSERVWPTILSWLVAVTASLVAALIFYLLTRNSGNAAH